MENNNEQKNVGKGTLEKSFKYIIAGIVVLAVITALLLIFPNVMLFRTYVATVGDEKVSIEEYKFFLAQAKSDILYKAGNPQDQEAFWNSPLEGGKTAMQIAKEQALDTVKDFEVQIYKAKEQGFKIEKEDKENTERYFESVIKDYYNGDKKAADTGMKELYGITLEEFKAIYEKSVLTSKLYQKETEGIKVEEKDLTEYYKNYPEQFINCQFRENGEEAVWARHILVKFPENATDEQKADTKKKAEELLQQIKDGKDFAELAREKSDDTGSASYGGDYVFGKGKMTADFEKVAFELAPGMVSDPVLTEYGYHIIKVEEKIAKDQPVSFKCATTYRDYALNNETIKADKYQAITNEWKKDPKFEVKTLPDYEKVR